MTAACCVVINPAAGGGRAGRALPAVRAALGAAGVRYQVCPSTSLEHAAGLAAAAAGRGEVVAAMGGDGLVGVLAGAVAGSGGVLALLPAGRGNDFARALGIPQDPAGAARTIAAGRARRVDLIGASYPEHAGEVLVAGSVYLGIPAAAAEIAARSRFPPGTLAYPVAAVRTVLAVRPAWFRLELDDGHGPVVREFTSTTAVIANTGYFGAGMHVAPGADPGDGLLDIVYFRGGSKAALIRGLAKIRHGSHVSMPQVSTARAGAVTVTAGQPVAAGADGEPLVVAARLQAGLPLRLRALPGVLSVLS